VGSGRGGGGGKRGAGGGGGGGGTCSRCWQMLLASIFSNLSCVKLHLLQFPEL